MNYIKIYNNLIERAKTRTLHGYKETHHIIPRCMGGSNDKSNLVDLTPEEHYLAHQILIRIYPNNAKLVLAAVMMIPNRPSNKLYGWLRRRFSEAKSKEQSGSGNSQYGFIWITDGKQEKRILKTEEIPDGWVNRKLVSYINEIQQKNKKIQINQQKQIKKQEELRKLFEIYNLYGFDEVKRNGYKFTKQNLVMSFAKNLPEFVPQNGKRRKKSELCSGVPER